MGLVVAVAEAEALITTTDGITTAPTALLLVTAPVALLVPTDGTHGPATEATADPMVRDGINTNGVNTLHPGSLRLPLPLLQQPLLIVVTRVVALSRLQQLRHLRQCLKPPRLQPQLRAVMMTVARTVVRLRLQPPQLQPPRLQPQTRLQPPPRLPHIGIQL